MKAAGPRLCHKGEGGHREEEQRKGHSTLCSVTAEQCVMGGQVVRMLLQTRLKGKGKCNCRLFGLSAHPLSGRASPSSGFLSPHSVIFRNFQLDVLQVESLLLCTLYVSSHSLMSDV